MRDRKGTKSPDADSANARSASQRSSRRPPRPPAVGKRRRAQTGCCNCSLGVFLLLAFALVCISLVGFIFYKPWIFLARTPTPIPRPLTPFPGKLVSDLPQFQGDYRERMFWGTYRSVLYLGIRAR